MKPRTSNMQNQSDLPTQDPIYISPYEILSRIQHHAAEALIPLLGHAVRYASTKLKFLPRTTKITATGDELRDWGLPLDAQSRQRKESWRCTSAAAPRIPRTDPTNGVPRSDPANSSSKRRRCSASKGCARTRRSVGRWTARSGGSSWRWSGG